MAGVHHNPTPGPAGEFRTKLEFAVELVQWALAWLSHWGKPLWVVADGAYAKAAFLTTGGTRGAL